MNHLKCVGPGWQDILLPVLEFANKHKIPIFQVKEKFGALRIYEAHVPPAISEEWWELVRAAEVKSLETCEECGKPGLPRGGGWIQTLCDAHAADRPRCQDEDYL